MTDFIFDDSTDFADLAKQKIAEFNAQHWDASKRQALGLKQLNANGEVVAMLAGRALADVASDDPEFYTWLADRGLPADNGSG